MNAYTLISNILVQRKKLIFLFVYLIIGAILLVGIRQFIVTDKTFLFLIWNLFLAYIPLVFSSILLQMNTMKYSNSRLILLGVIWLLFFPNAPYMLTDFIHLSYGNQQYLWIDILTISWFAVSAFLAGIVSLNDIVNILHSKLNKRKAALAVFGISISTGFGIYLGRYLRFNSWDIINNPSSLLKQITERVFNPMQHPRTWLVTIGFGCLLWLVFKTFKIVSSEFIELKNR